jgi:hypothetical protein
MEKKSSKSLYAYFGELGLFDTNIPGHTFYQIGLMDALSEKFKVDQFDFLNYVSDKYTSGSIDPVFPKDNLGELMTEYTRKLVNNYQIAWPEVMEKITNREYDKIFLKARFRNLSTLEKKLKDAKIFEDTITTALEVGYDPADIVIIDTDLSLSESFLSTIESLGLSREIPSITMPGMSKAFIQDCLRIHENSTESPYINLMYYGNLSFDNYKEGHSKNPIINDIIQSVDQTQMFDGTTFTMTVAAKKDLSLDHWIGAMNRVSLTAREDRARIWQNFSHSIVSVNVSKDLYIKEKFIPARVYESIIFGVIPVSYKWGQHPAMTFETVEDFWEICKFLAECSRQDYLKILRLCADRL